MRYNIARDGENIIVGNDLKIEVKRLDAKFDNEPYMLVFDGDTYKSSKRKAMITIENPRYIGEGRLDEKEKMMLKNMMDDNTGIMSPWYVTIMEVAREFAIANPGHKKDFLSLRDGSPSDFSMIKEGD